jgi:hypothetical protein
MYETIADMFEEIAKDDSSIAVITGKCTRKIIY